MELNLSRSQGEDDDQAEITFCSILPRRQARITIQLELPSAQSRACLVILLGGLLASGFLHGQATIELTTVPASPAAAGSAIQLKAAVTLDKVAVTGGGTVYFYDDSVTPRLIGSAQMNAQGMASIVVRLSSGAHTLSAYHPPANGLWAGPSARMSFIVSVAPLPTQTAIAQTSIAGSPLLTATVAGKGGTEPTGNISFRDAGDADSVLATMPVGAA